MKLPMPPSLRGRNEHGFTLVELMVAALVLVVGLLGVLGMFTGALRTTATNNERVGATNLARELVEAARSVTYDDLTTADVAAAIQALPNMGSGSPWVVTRRNVKYTITTQACVYDDPVDKLEAGRAGVCPGGPAGVIGDRNGDDFRRVTFDISWKAHGVTRDVKQTTLIVNPTGGLGPRITSFEPTVSPITGGTTASFLLTSTWAETIHWATDDGQSSGDLNGPATSWNLVWNLGTVGAAGSVVDGTYRVNAQAFDSRGIAGDSKVASVTINRNTPFALENFSGGYNARFNPDIVDLQWSPTRERDIVGYRVYDAGPDKESKTADDELVCPAGGGVLQVHVISCSDENPRHVAGAYFIVAVDSTGPGEAAATSMDLAGAQPQRPASLNATFANGGVELSWPASTSAGVVMYRIYRGGTAIGNRIGISTGTTFNDSGADGSAAYWVTAVDANFNESEPIGSVSP